MAKTVKQAGQRTAKKRVGNPNWGQTYKAVPVVVTPTQFESFVSTLNLKPDQYVKSKPLIEWGRKNHRKFYIPPHLLDVWGLDFEDVE